MRYFSLPFYFFLLMIGAGAAQNITNTLGSSGTFSIADNSNTFLSLSQSTGYLSLEKSLSIPTTSGSTIGVIYKSGTRFIHNFQASGTSGANTFVGVGAGNFTMSGSDDQASFNSAFGTSSFASNTTGHRNASFGSSSLQNNTSGYQNSAFGNVSLYSNTSGYNNSAFGHSSLVGSTSGYNNSAFGYYAGNNVTTGSNLTLIGYNAQPSSATATNEITLGDGNIATIRANVQSITSLSDARDKKNIQDLNLGIDFLMKIKPRLFYWDKREWYDNNVSDGSKMLNEPTAGFIAQEFDELQAGENAAWLNLVLKTNPDRFEANYGNLLPVMVKAIQELKKENERLSELLEQYQVTQNFILAELRKRESENNIIKTSSLKSE